MSAAYHRPMSRPQLVALRAADAGALRIERGRLVMDADFSVFRVTMASVRAVQRRGLLETANPITGFFPLTDAGRRMLTEGCTTCGLPIEDENTCGESRVCFDCAGAPRL